MKIERALEKGALNLINQYQKSIIGQETNHPINWPNTSEMVKDALIWDGLIPAFRATLMICNDRASQQVDHIHQNIHSLSEKVKQSLQKTLTPVFLVYGGLETAATIFNQKERLDKLNASLGVADWGPKTINVGDGIIVEVNKKAKPGEAAGVIKFPNGQAGSQVARGLS